MMRATEDSIYLHHRAARCSNYCDRVSGDQCSHHGLAIYLLLLLLLSHFLSRPSWLVYFSFAAPRCSRAPLLLVCSSARPLVCYRLRLLHHHGNSGEYCGILWCFAASPDTSYKNSKVFKNVWCIQVVGNGRGREWVRPARCVTTVQL